jgi:exosortase A
MFGYLVWVRRKRIFAVQPCPNYWGFLCLAILAVVWLLGSLGEARVVEEFALLAMIGALIWALLGTQVLHILRFPLAFLFFAVPFGVALVPPLQDSTAWFVIHALTLSNVPAVLDNRTISLPNSVWTIAETCSGIRYMFASIVLGLFYSSLVYRLRKRQLLFLGASIALPVAANALRAYGIVLVGYLSNNKLAVGVDHIIYGGVFFVAIEIALLAAGVRWRESPELAAEEPRESITGVPFPRKLVIAAPAAAGVLLLTPLLSEYLWNKSAADPAPAELAVLVDPSWREAATYDYGWNPGLHRPDRELGQEYESGEHRVHLYCALYSGQRGTELAGSSVGYGNPGLWSVASEKVGHEFLHGRSVTVNKSLLQSGLNMRSVWTMYWVGGEYTASPARAKLLQAKARLLGNAASAVVIVLGSEDLSNRPDTAERTLQDFLAHASFPMSSQL